MSPADPRLRAMLRLAPVIPVYTPGSVDEAVAVAQALLDGGLPVIEVTLRTPVALEAIAADRGMSLATLVAERDAARAEHGAPLASTLRVFALMERR